MGVRLKRWGLLFFYHPLDITWNLLDFVIVMGGVLEQWMMPVMGFIQSLVAGRTIVHAHHSTSLLPLLRMMRLLRILRLLRLLKSIKPLYKLTIGVLEAMQAMQWVMVLTVVLLYASGILFTSLVGRALIPGGGVPDEARDLFGSVTGSMFLLFRVMNGDQGPIEPLFSTLPLRFLCVTYVVVSNWAVLAILTAVVSENMITATREHEKIEEAEIASGKTEQFKKHLVGLFKELDKDGDGNLDQDEFEILLANDDNCKSLRDETGLQVSDLNDLFHYLSHQGEDGLLTINYEGFIAKLQVEGKPVSERSVFRVEKQMQNIEQNINRKLDCIQDGLSLQAESCCHTNAWGGL